MTALIPGQLYEERSVAAPTALANLEKAAKAREFTRSVADITDSLTKKNVKGRIYWYWRAKNPDGKPQQVYRGPEGP